MYIFGKGCKGTIFNQHIWSHLLFDHNCKLISSPWQSCCLWSLWKGWKRTKSSSWQHWSKAAYLIANLKTSQQIQRKPAKGCKPFCVCGTHPQATRKQMRGKLSQKPVEGWKPMRQKRLWTICMNTKLGCSEKKKFEDWWKNRPNPHGLVQCNPAKW